MAVQFGCDLVRRFAIPAQEDYLRMKFPISGCMMASGQLAHLVFFLRILCRSRFHLLWPLKHHF
jgi:hypothetical protein